MNSILSMLAIWIIIGTICSLVAKSKGKNQILWFFIGVCFSVLGLLILLLLPAKKKPPEGTSTLAPVQSMNSDGAMPSEEEGYHAPSPPVKRIKPDPSLKWYYIFETPKSAEVRGPINIDELRKAVVYLKLPLTTYIWCEEFADWTQIVEFQNPSYLTDKELIIDAGDETKYDSTKKSPQNAHPELPSNKPESTA